MGTAFLDDSRRAAVLVQRVARQVEDLGALAGRLRDLWLEAMADDADAVQLEIQLVGHAAMQGVHETGKGTGSGEAPGQRAGDGVGVLYPQMWEQKQGLGFSWGHVRAPP